MKCQGLLSDKMRCKNKGKSFLVKMIVEEKEVTQRIVLCEVHVHLQQAVNKIQQLQEKLK